MPVTQSALPNLDQVFAKWEHRRPGPTGDRNRSDHVTNGSRGPADGRQRWRDKFGQNVQPLRYKKTRERNRVTAVPAEVVKSNTIAQFKSAPTILPEHFIVSRPFMGSCCACMPNSQKDLMTFHTQTRGIRNILDVAHELRHSGVLARKLGIQAYAWQVKTKHKYPEISAAVLTSQRVLDVIERERLKGNKSGRQKDPEKRAKEILSVMQSNVSNVLTKLTGWFLQHFLGMLLNGIHVHKGQMQMIKAASEREIPVMYLPLHKSHLDYILITFILWNYQVKSPYIAAGDNLNIPFFSWLMKGLGGYFIRRKLDNGAGKDNLYRAVLQSYMEELLRSGEALEFFVEGGRSRTGKAYPPKGGLMSILVDTLNRGVVEDVYVAPISISYEKILDGNFCSEQMGIPKKRESFFGAVRGIWRVLNGFYGSVRVDFAQPFSLKEYLQTYQSSSPVSPVLSPPLSPRSLSPVSVPRMSSRDSCLSLYGNGTDIIDEERQIVKMLGEHVVYTCVQSSAIMCTNVLAFLFLTKYRQGGCLAQIVKDYGWLREEIMVRKRDVGFSPSSKMEEVVHYANSLLGPGLVDKRVEGEDIILCPHTGLPDIFELSYYGNSVISVFLVESVLVNSVIFLSNASLSNDDESSQREVALISREQILEVAEQLCNMLKYEFHFVPPCKKLDEMLADMVDQLVTMEILRVQDTQQYDACHGTFDKQWASRLSNSLSWADEEEEEGYFGEEERLLVNLDQADIVEKMRFLHSVLAPILEAYLVTVFHISQVVDREIPEDEFLKKIHAHAKERVELGVASYGESASLETLKNSIKAFQDLKIIDVYYAGNVKMVELHNHFDVKDKLNHFISMLESLRETVRN